MPLQPDIFTCAHYFNAVSFCSFSLTFSAFHTSFTFSDIHLYLSHLSVKVKKCAAKLRDRAERLRSDFFLLAESRGVRVFTSTHVDWIAAL